MSGFRHPLRRSLAVGALVLVLAPFAGTTPADAATPPPAQGTGTFCANATTTNPFTDVSQSTESAHYANILCALSAGITVGKTSTTYAPKQTVSRAQMASFVARGIDEANRLVAPGI